METNKKSRREKLEFEVLFWEEWIKRERSE